MHWYRINIFSAKTTLTLSRIKWMMSLRPRLTSCTRRYKWTIQQLKTRASDGRAPGSELEFKENQTRGGVSNTRGDHRQKSEVEHKQMQVRYMETENNENSRMDYHYGLWIMAFNPIIGQEGFPKIGHLEHHWIWHQDSTYPPLVCLILNNVCWYGPLMVQNQ